ncbi:proline dehydrogenase [Paenibacillus endophyticus]|uniref:proline dehydrogenase n=1 Tax=Paenibacillus endophyticus TaxID=1294268 RepID=A0A7W5C959_9BACL|nr:proline dehydrogenase [Paenibacillus endophyticus]MBB3153438.1 proline dehydrogenase [Paenibacillus endophyticus]
MEKLMRSFFLTLGKSRRVGGLARKYGLRLGASRFVAGVEINSSIEAVKKLNKQGKMATLDHLGEFISSKQEAEHSTEMCRRTLASIAASGVNANLSLKLTSLGLDLGSELCESQMRRILELAEQTDNFVRIDMEDYAHCQPALDLYQKLRASSDRVGIVIQAYLYRSEQDVQELGLTNANLRLVKGAYKEPKEVAFPLKTDVDQSYMRLIEQHLLSGSYTAIATHDRDVIQQAKAFIRDQGIPVSQFEFQMLYGICEELQDELVLEGYRVRIYVPYGEDWFGYFMRRLAERPDNVWFVLKNMWK